MSRLWIQLDTAVGLRCSVLVLFLAGDGGILVVLVDVGDGEVALGVLVGVGLLGLGRLGGLDWVGWVGLGLVLALALAKIAAGFRWDFFIFSVCLNVCSCRVLGVRGGFGHSSRFLFFAGVWVSNLVGTGLGFLFLVVFWMPKSDVFIRHIFPSILVNSFQVLVGRVGLGTILGSLGLGVVGWVGLGWEVAVVLHAPHPSHWPGRGCGVLADVAAHPWSCLGWWLAVLGIRHAQACWSWGCGG